MVFFKKKKIYGLTPLHKACQNMSSDIVKLLINDPRVEVNPRALIILNNLKFFNREISNFFFQMTFFFIKFFFYNVFIYIIFNNDILDFAVQSANDDIVQAVFDKRGIDFDSRGKGVFFLLQNFFIHTTPLHIACQNNDKSTIQVLISHPKIDVNIRDVLKKWIFFYFV